jgi:serine protease
MRWAAGLTVVGAPPNPYPARVINLSLGADGPCLATYADLVQQLSALGVLVVASAGNDGGTVDAPGNCPGVIGVGGIRHVGSKVGFSNLGPGVAISAPGGNCVNTGAGQPCLFSIDTTVDTGTTGPAGPTYTDQFNFNVGTSFSSPIVAGAAALMHSVNARLTPAHLTARLQQSARAFPTTSPTTTTVCHVPLNGADLQTAECICTTDTCGAGMLDAEGAVHEAERPIVSIQLPAFVNGGQNVTLNANGSAAACNRRVTTFAWTEVPNTGVVINGADQSVATVQAPTSGSFTLQLTITDDQGAQDSANVTVSSSNATTTALAPLAGNACPTPITVVQDPNPPTNPPPSGGGGGGGGGLSAALLAFLAVALCMLRMRRGARAGTREPAE